MTTFYVSNTVANAIGIGSDGNDGSQNTPFLTLDEALAVARDGDTIYLNNGTYSPAAGTFDITTGVNIESVVDGGATIIGSGGEAPIAIDVVNGGTVTLGSVNVDAQNTAPNAIHLLSETTTYTLDLHGTHLYYATGYAVAGQDNARANITATDVTYMADTSRGMIGLSSLAAGNIDIERGSVTLADQVTDATIGGSGQLGNSSIALIDASAAGVSVHVADVTVNAAIDAMAVVGSALTVMNVANAVIEDNTMTVSGSAAGANDIVVSYDRLSPLDSSGAIVRDNHLENFNTGGGVLIFVGQDGNPGESLWGYADNAQIYGNSGTGNAASQAADLHGVLVGWQTGASVHDNEMDNTALAYVMKGDFGATVVYGNVDKNTASNSWYQKGGEGAEWLGNVSYQGAGYTPVGLFVGSDQESGTTNYASGGVALNNTVWYAGQSGHFVYVETGSGIAVVDGNHYHADGGLISSAWYWDGTFYRTLASWQTDHEPHATATPAGLSFAQFMDEQSANHVVSIAASGIETLTAQNISPLSAAGITTLAATDAKPDIGNLATIAFAQGGLMMSFPGGTAGFSAPAGKNYTGLETDRDDNGVLTDRIYSGVTGSPYTSYRYDFDNAGHLIAKTYAGVAGKIYTSYRDDYDVAGHLVDKSYLGVTTKLYTSYGYHYDAAGDLVSRTFDGVTGKIYTSYQYNYDADDHIDAKLYFGVTGHPYSSYEFDYNAADQLIAKIYSGVTDHPYTSYEYDYNSGAELTAKNYYGGSSGDMFMLQAAALGGTNAIDHFDTAHGDRIYLTDVLNGHYDPVSDAIADFVSLSTSGSDTLLKVDLDGAGTTYHPTTVATIHSVTDLDLATLISHHNLIVPT